MAANAGQISRARPLTAWDQAQGWQAARRAMTRDFLRQAEATRQSFDTAWSTHIENAVDFAFEVAVNRIRAEASAKALAASAETVGKVWTPPTSVYAGASVIDLAN